MYVDLTASRFCGSSASINDVLPHLASAGFCFVVGRAGMDGCIVRSDLDRHPARSHFYNLVAGVEIRLSDLIRLVISPVDVAGCISDRTRFDGGASLLTAYQEAERNT